MDIENRVKKRGTRKKIQDIALKSLYTAAVVGIAITAPNSIQLLRYVKGYIDNKSHLNRRMSQAFSRLVAKGLIAKNSEGHFRVTVKGRHAAESLLLSDRLMKKPLRWDGKWRIAIFDVWESRRGVRDRLRNILGRNGFVKIQNSVWVHPYDCEELFVFLRMNLSLGRAILYIVAEEVERDAWLRKHFNLRSVS